jgi:hypothetical protein
VLYIVERLLPAGVKMARSVEHTTREEGPRGPVGLRLGDLQPEVYARQSDTAAPGAVVKRDLGRYYMLLRDGRRLLSFGLSEAEALVRVLLDFDAAAVQYIWAQVEKEYREHAENEEGRFHYLPIDFDPVPFIDHLRRLSLHQNVALLDTVERYWVLVSRKYPEQPPFSVSDDDLLVEVGLVTAERVAFDRQIRQRTAEEWKEGKIVLRDMLGRLRTKTRDDEPMSGYEPVKERG